MRATQEQYKALDAFEGSDLEKLLLGFAKELMRSHNRLEDLVRECNPLYAAETLNKRYEEAGFPDPCLSGNNPTSTDLKRTQILMQWAATGGCTVAYFEYLLGRVLGEANFKIYEYELCEAGRATAGTACYGSQWLNCWHIRAVLPGYRHFTSSASTSGEPLQSWEAAIIECVIRRFAPAHTLVTFATVDTPEEL
jgi:uncharacterized protein YmfQ (DUF2313 family)